MLRGIIIGATRGILEYQRLPPGLAWRSAVSALFQENQFRLQNLQNVALIFVHDSAPSILVCLGGAERAVTRVTLGCAPCHRKLPPPVVHWWSASRSSVGGKLWLIKSMSSPRRASAWCVRPKSGDSPRRTV